MSSGSSRSRSSPSCSLALARWAQDGLLGVERDLLGLFKLRLAPPPSGSSPAPASSPWASSRSRCSPAVPHQALPPPRLPAHRQISRGIVMSGAVTGSTTPSRTASSTGSPCTRAPICRRPPTRPRPDRVLVHHPRTVRRPPVAPSGCARSSPPSPSCSSRVEPRPHRAVRPASPSAPPPVCLVLLLYGRPDQRPTFAAVRAALAGHRRAGGGADAGPEPRPARRAYFIAQPDGSRLYTKVKSPEERSADLLFRTYRFVRLKNVGDERPFLILRRASSTRRSSRC